VKLIEHAYNAACLVLENLSERNALENARILKSLLWTS